MSENPTTPDSASSALEDELVSMSVELGNAYEELSLLHRLSGTLRVERPIDDVLRRACADLVAGAGLRFAAIRLVGEAGDTQRGLGGLAGAFEWAACAGGGGGVSEPELRRLRPAVEAAGGELLRSGPDVVPNSILGPAQVGCCPRLATLADELITVPLSVRGERAGWLFAGPMPEAPPLTSAEAKMAEAISGPLSIFLENRLLFEETRALATGVLASLVRTLDAKDPYTRGHSERVGAMAAAIGRELHLDPEACERLELAGLVHDLGKIGVPESILLKEGRLTNEEFGRIKEHPERGVEILRGLDPLADLLPAVLHHHERFEGGGYPSGIAGEAIPFSARIIGLADAFDAIGSRRSYRDASPPGACLAEIQRCAGTHFDPRVVEAFLRLQARAGVFPDAATPLRRHAA